MAQQIDLSFYPFVSEGAGAFWQGIPANETANVPAWQWSPGMKFVIDGDLETIDALLAAGWERLTGPEGVERWNDDASIDGTRYLRLTSMLSMVHLVKLTGRDGQDEYELWGRSEDIRRVHDCPVTLAWAWLEWVGMLADTLPDTVLSTSPRGLMTLHVAQELPPPQFGEIALVDHIRDGQRVWEIYTLAALGDEGLALWERIGAALKRLAAPAEWWPYTPQLAACLRGEYAQLREALRVEMQAAPRSARAHWQERLSILTLDQKHATAIHTARERARQDTAAWLAQWEEIRQMAAELAALYWAAHLAATAIPATPDETAEPATSISDADTSPDETEPEPAAAIGPVAEVAQMPEEAALMAQIVESTAPTMDTTNFDEDKAVRQAILSQSGQWTTEEDTPRYEVSRNLAVYLTGTRDSPLTLEEAQARLLDKRPRTILTIRIAQALWNLRRNDPKLGRNGRALIPYNEILAWRGVPKQHRYAHPGTDSGQIVTDGYRTEDRESVRRDLELASRFYLRGHVNVTYKGKTRLVNVDDYYVNVGFISIPTLWGDEPAGVWFGPGSWIDAHTEADNYFLAEVDRRIFELSPHHEQHEMKIGLYLTERWREQAHKGNYADPITMADLLRNSVIDIDKPNLTSRFAPRIEQAIATLQARGIASFECLNTPDKSKRNWGKDWLAARWRILPPEALRQSYIDKGITQTARQLPSGRPGQPKNGKGGGNGTGQKG